MCVDGHGFGVLDVRRNGGGGLYACVTKPRVWSHVGMCRSTSRVRDDTQMTSVHTAYQVRSSV